MRRAAFHAVLGLSALLALPSFGGPPSQKTSAPRGGLEAFFRKRNVTIAVTDSGLGGLAVLAEAAARMKPAGAFARVDFVFYNALFSSGGGYNSLKTREEKIRIFDGALNGLEERYRPDLILVACNTLSVLLGDTAFSRRSKIPIVGIVDAGVEMIAERLRAEPGSSVIIFGTPTTISEGTHKRELERAGFAPERIAGQSCPELESYIERGPAGDETGMLIASCVDEALQRLPSPPPPLFASLNCTHYGYSLPLWEKAFAEAGLKPLGVLNPNSRMIGFLFTPGRAGRFPKTEVGVRVVSMVEITPEKIAALGSCLTPVSPETAQALKSYEFVPGLFKWSRQSPVPMGQAGRSFSPIPGR